MKMTVIVFSAAVAVLAMDPVIPMTTWNDDRTHKYRYRGARLRRAATLATAQMVKRMTAYKATPVNAPVIQPPRNHCRWRRPG